MNRKNTEKAIWTVSKKCPAVHIRGDGEYNPVEKTYAMTVRGTCPRVLITERGCDTEEHALNAAYLRKNIPPMVWMRLMECARKGFHRQESIY